MCLHNNKWASDCDYADNSNAGDHDLKPKYYYGSIPVEEKNTFLPDQKDPVNSMLAESRYNGPLEK
jgi:hypothetical protein